MSNVDQKVVLLGLHSVGKSCLVERYLVGRWKGGDMTATVGAAFGAKRVSALGKEYTLGLWDTAGAERYDSMMRIYYRNANAAIICYDLTEAESWQKVRYWVEELQRNEPACALYIVGNKLDMIQNGEAHRALAIENVEAYAANVGARSFETSSKTGENVDLLFNAIARDFVSSGNLNRPSAGAASGQSGSGVRLDSSGSGSEEAGGCC